MTDILMSGQDIKNAIYRETKALRSEIKERAQHDSDQSADDIMKLAHKLQRYTVMYDRIDEKLTYEIREHVQLLAGEPR